MRKVSFSSAIQGPDRRAANGEASAILTPWPFHAAGVQGGLVRTHVGRAISEAHPIKNNLIGDFVLAAATFGVAAVPSLGPTAALTLLAVLAAVSVDCAIKALFLSVLVVSFNPGLMSETGGISLARWFPITVALATAARTGRPRRIADWVTTLGIAFFLIACVTGIALSPYNGELAWARLASFVLGLLTAFALAARSRTGIGRWLDFLFGMLAMVVLASLPLLAHPIGRLKNSTGFQGILSHPQTFGVLVGLLPIIAISQVMTKQTSVPRLLLLILSGLGTMLLWESEARTAILSLSLALAVGLALRLTVTRISRQERSNWIRAVIAVLLAALAYGPFVSNDLPSEVLDFLVKRRVRGTASIDRAIESLAVSRRAKAEEHLWTIGTFPEFGAGFGVDPFANNDRSGTAALLGIPVSSPIEPGVMPLAVAAQTGICGLLFFSVFSAGIARQALRSRHAIGVMAFLYFGISSFGEGYAFSFGGLGLYLWLVVAIIYSDGSRDREHAPGVIRICCERPQTVGRL